LIRVTFLLNLCHVQSCNIGIEQWRRYVQIGINNGIVHTGAKFMFKKKMAMWGLQIGAMHNLSTLELKDAIRVEYNDELTSQRQFGHLPFYGVILKFKCLFDKQSSM
jgi:hypothetical protein